MLLMMLKDVIILDNGHEIKLFRNLEYECKVDLEKLLLKEGWAIPVKTYAPVMGRF